MTFIVKVHPNAVADLDGIHEYISQHAQSAADRTYGMLKEAILGLVEFPHRFSLARESANSSIELRQVVAGKLPNHLHHYWRRCTSMPYRACVTTNS